MFGSKSRSGSSDFVKKNRYSVISRTFSATKICRGDPLVSQIDAKALKPVDRPSSRFSDVSEKIGRAFTMQRHTGDQLEQELKLIKERLGAVEEARDKAFEELRDTKLLASEAGKANMKLSEELSDSTKELKMRDRNIDLFKLELEKAKDFEVKLMERDESLGRLKEELSSAKASEAHAVELLSHSKRRIEELEDEFERGKVSETKMYARLVSQTKKFEKTKTQLEESELEVTSLREKMEVGACNHEEVDSLKESLENLRSELQLAKENLGRAREGEKVASLKAKRLFEDMNLLRNEMKLAMAAEEKSKKAMDDLALALKEVATEANQAKEKLNLTELELERIKQEAEELKAVARGIEDRYKRLLDEQINEKERVKNMVERLRFEAEETLLAWNDKEIGFVDCIKRAEDERNLAQKENARLIESLKSTGNTTKVSREENFKLRDILKQALNEASVAKAAASIAREENSRLQDSNAEKDETLDFLTRENERLRISEAAANESIKALKRLLSVSSKKESKTEEKGQNGAFKPARSVNEEGEDGRKRGRAFSFDLCELKLPRGYEDANEEVIDEDPVKAETLKGSIFDTVDTPKSEPHTPRHRRVPSSFTDDGKSINSEDSDYLECSSSCDDERSSQRKSRQLLRRFGDLVKRKSSSFRKEPSIE